MMNKKTAAPAAPKTAVPAAPSGVTVLNVYALNERAVNGEQKTFWTRIGRAFRNRDGSITLRLDALPVSGNMQIREEDPTRFDAHDRGEG